MAATLTEVRCTRCGESKPPECFSRSSDNKTGLHSYCKQCMSEYMRGVRHPMHHAPRNCEWCSTEFVPKDTRKRFCSDNCKMRARWARTHPRDGKTCRSCGTSIDHRRRDAKWCSETCAMRERTPELRRKYRLWSKYKITPEHYDEMIVKQGGVCAICGGDNPKTKHGFWHVDHCHDSNAVRGLLCSTCNTGIGSFYDRPDVLIRAAEYLTKTE